MGKQAKRNQEKAVATLRAIGGELSRAASVGGMVAKAALLGNEAESALSIAAHDPLRNLEQMLGEPPFVSGAAAPTGGSIPDSDLVKLFRATGTAVWKLEQRMLNAETKEPKDDFRRVWRHIEAIKDALEAVGVDVIDWTGKRYDEGMSLKVVSEEERSGTKEPEIIETLLPTIRFRKQIQLQQGEVVVSRPAAPAAKEPTNL